MKAVFFSDLDGTLLDHDTYSYDLSLEGITLLREHSIPLIPVSSKTFYEISGLMKKLSLNSPFAFENGSGIAWPGTEHEYYNLEIAGPGIEQLRDFFPEFERISGKKLISLLSLDINEISEITGLGMDLSALAKKRLSSIPFLAQDKHLLSDDEIKEINLKLQGNGLHITKGSRFNHLIPLQSGKDRAVKKIIEFYRGEYNDEILTGAAGDSINDLPMFECVDHPYIIRKKDSSSVYFTRAKIINENGPEGFTLAVKDFLQKVTG